MAWKFNLEKSSFIVYIFRKKIRNNWIFHCALMNCGQMASMDPYPEWFYLFLSRSFSSPCSYYFLHAKCIIPLSFFQLLWSWLLSPALPSRLFVSVVLAVCQMYPGLQISHVEEASSPATIQGWCKKGLGKCQTRPFIVVPYRCLGESQTHPEPFIIPDIPSRMLLRLDLHSIIICSLM